MTPARNKPIKPHCASCKHFDCYRDKDCFDSKDMHRGLYKSEPVARMHRAATSVEGKYYCRETRLGEIILFAEEMGYRKLGIAFCIGLKEEAHILEQILKRRFEIVSVCCKVASVPKSDFGLEQIDPGKNVEVMCNPVGQAQILNEAGTEMNIICGLCVGHDALFTQQSISPTTTFIVKDRVLGHNPAAALYVSYIRKTFLSGDTVDEDLT